MQFANRVHINLMPTELFVRRPLLWMQMAAKKRATITCSPNFGYRHFLKVLGDRRLEGVDLSRMRADLQRRRADLGRAVQRVHARLAHTGLKRSAMYPVYGLAEASPRGRVPAARLRIPLDPRQSPQARRVGCAIEINPAEPRDAHRADVRRAGRAEHGTAHRGRGARRAGRRTGRPHPDPRANVTRGYFGDAGGDRRAPSAPTGWLDTGDLGVMHEGALYIAGRSQGNHLHQRPELLSLRSGEHRAARPRAGTRTRWSRPASRNPARRARSSWCSCSTGQPAGISADGRRGGASDQRAHGHRGRAGRPRQAHPEDHQRQGAAAPARAVATRTASSTPTRGTRRVARAHGAARRSRVRSSKGGCRRSARRRCRAGASRSTTTYSRSAPAP